MLISERFLPSEAIVGGKPFFNHGGKQLNTTDTRLSEYIVGLMSDLRTQGISFNLEENWPIQASAALIDALTKTQFSTSSDYPELESGHHVFNVFYQAPRSTEWKLAFANSAYIEKIGANLSESVGKNEKDLMQPLYLPKTIEGFDSAAKNISGGYRAKRIEMDKLSENDNGNRPAFFWYRKTLDHPDGGKIQVRIGMDGTDLSPEQEIGITDVYKLADELRLQYVHPVHYSRPSSNLLIQGIRGRISDLLKTPIQKNRDSIEQLGFLLMILEITNDIEKNSSLPFTLLDKNNEVRKISTAYAAVVGYSVGEILKPDFFNRIYPGTEGKIVLQSIEYYNKHGRYPEDVTFMARRGNNFNMLENRHNFNIPKEMEVIPFPSTFGEVTVRLNSVRPAESLAHLFAKHN